MMVEIFLVEEDCPYTSIRHIHMNKGGRAAAIVGFSEGFRPDIRYLTGPKIPKWKKLLYKLIKHCWHREYDERLSFEEILVKLNEIKVLKEEKETEVDMKNRLLNEIKQEEKKKAEYLSSFPSVTAAEVEGVQKMKMKLQPLLIDNGSAGKTNDKSNVLLSTKISSLEKILIEKDKIISESKDKIIDIMNKNQTIVDEIIKSKDRIIQDKDNVIEGLRQRQKRERVSQNESF